MSKYQMMNILKGNQTIDVHKYFRERNGHLADFKKSFGQDQTGTDEKFFKEKEQLLQDQEELFRSFAEDLGFKLYRNVDIHISFSEKKEK